jgi:hypothetical protein
MKNKIKKIKNKKKFYGVRSITYVYRIKFKGLHYTLIALSLQYKILYL